VHIEQCEPILEGLKSETAEDEHDAEGSKAAFGEIVGVVFDVRIDCNSYSRNDARHQTHANRKGPGVIHMMDKGATKEGRSDVAERAENRSLKLAA